MLPVRQKNIPARQIHFALPPKALLYTFIISICTSFVAFALLQLGIRELGAATASIFCLLEPLTSVISGCAFLGEAFSVRKLLGCLLVLGAVVLVLLSVVLTLIGGLIPSRKAAKQDPVKALRTE